MIRLLSDGTPDATFGAGGSVTLGQPAGTTAYFSPANGWDNLKVAPDGSIVYVGTLSLPSQTSSDWLVRYTSSGVLDTSFSGDGYWSADNKIRDYGHFPDGKILVLRQTGSGNYSSGTGDEQTIRLMPNGSFDPTFVPAFMSADGTTDVGVEISTAGANPGFVVYGSQAPYTAGSDRIRFFTNTGVADAARPDLAGDFNDIQAGPNGTYLVSVGVETSFRRLLSSGTWSNAFALDGYAEVSYLSESPSVSDVKVDSKGRPVVLWFGPSAARRISRIKYAAPTPVTIDEIFLLGQSRRGGQQVADPVDTASGNLTDSFVDLRGESFGLTLTRAYNGLDTVATSVGVRWRVAVGSSIGADGDGVLVTVSDGTRFRFAPAGGGVWVRPAGLDADLMPDAASPTGGGSLPMLRLVYDDGRIERFDTLGRLVAAINWDGQSAASVYDPQGRLTTVTSTTGDVMSFGYGSTGALVDVSLSDGRTVTYGYDDLSGLLSEFVDEHGAGFVFYYTDEGWLTEIEGPNGFLLFANTYDDDGRVLTQWVPSGGTTTFLYAIAEGVTFVTDSVTGTTLQYQHDPAGRVTFVSDPFAKTVENVFDSQSNLVATTDRLGNTASATYNAHGKPLVVVEPGVGTTSFTYDSADRLTSHTDPWGQLTTYTYGGNSRIPSTVTNPLNQTSTTVVVDGLVMSQTDADGVTVSYTYDSKRRPITSTDEYNNVTTTTYDAQGRVTSTISPSGRTTSYVYNTDNRLVSVTNPDGGVSAYTYDAAGHVLTVTDPTGAVTTNTYDAAGLLATVNAPGNHVTTYTYDGNGQLISTADPSGGMNSTAYGPLGRVDSSADELGRSTTYSYNADGDMASTTDAANATVQTQYDTVGRPFKTVDAANRETVTTYDSHGRALSVTAPGNRITTYAYDALGRITQVTDPRGGVTSTTYTPGGRTDTMTDAVGLVTDYAYDLAGRIASITAPGNRTTTYTHNTNSELAAITSPGGLVTTYAYDLAGRLQTITDPTGVVTTRTWSTRDELLTEKVGAQGTVTYTYNPDGTAATVTDAVGKLTTFGYDSRSNLTSQTNALGGVDSWSYNAANELVSATDPLNRVTTYTYDPLGRLASSTDPSGRTITTTFNSDGTPASRAELNGSTTTFVYDTAGRMSGATDPTGTYGYTYEPGGQLATMLTPAGRVTRWTYDAAGRRTAITNPDGSSYKYTYDTAGRVATIKPGEILADSFTATNNTALEASKWTTVNTAGATATVQANAARLQWTNTANSATSITSTPAATQDHEISYRYRFATTTSTTVGTLTTAVRNSTAGNIRVEQVSNSTTAKIFKQIGTTSTQLGTFTVPVTTAERRIRVQLQGSTIRVRVWADGTTEPTTWTRTLNTATGVTTAGQARLTAKRTSGTNNVVVDDVTQTNPTTPPAAIATYTYNADDQITNEALTGGTRTRTFTAGRLTNYTTSVAGLAQTAALTYDSTGRIATENTGGITTTYGYDLASQLTAATPSTGTANSWTYDSLGRRATQTIGATTTRNVYDNASQLCWSTTSALPANPTCAAPAPGAITYTYDQAGRLLTDTTTATNKVTYTYDSAGRMATSQRVNGAVTTNQTRSYNPFNNLHAVTSGTTTVQLDWDPTVEVARLLGTVNAGTTQTVAAGPSGWIAARSGGVNVAVGQRYDGSVIPSTGTTALARSGTYDAFGTPTGTDQALPRLGYRGEVHVDNLIYLRNRNYQPGTGHFTSPDPLEGVAGTTTIAHPYHYADNNPVHNIDPLGLQPQDTEFNGLDSVPVGTGSSGGLWGWPLAATIAPPIPAPAPVGAPPVGPGVSGPSPNPLAILAYVTLAGADVASGKDLPNLPNLPDLPDLPGRLPNLPNLPDLPNLPKIPTYCFGGLGSCDEAPMMAPNERQNKQFRDALKECQRAIGYVLGQDERRELHDEINRRFFTDPTYQEIVELCIEMFG